MNRWGNFFASVRGTLQLVPKSGGLSGPLEQEALAQAPSLFRSPCLVERAISATEYTKIDWTVLYTLRCSGAPEFKVQVGLLSVSSSALLSLRLRDVDSDSEHSSSVNAFCQSCMIVAEYNVTHLVSVPQSNRCTSSDLDSAEGNWTRRESSTAQQWARVRSVHDPQRSSPLQSTSGACGSGTIQLAWPVMPGWCERDR